jgi:hypothetical protein
MIATAAAAPEPYKFTGVNEQGYGCYDETGPDEVTETIPPLPENHTKLVADGWAVMRAHNARLPRRQRLPVCRECKCPTPRNDMDSVYPWLCSCCGTQRLYEQLDRLMATWGHRAGRIKLEALCRSRPAVNIGPVPFSKSHAGDVRPAGDRSK